MAWNFSDIRAALKTRLDTIEGLRAYDNAPGQVNVPAAVVTPAAGEFITYGTSMGGQSDELAFIITLLVDTALTPNAQKKLDAYLDGAGPGSVRAVVEASGLGSGAELQKVTGVRSYGLIEYAGTDYLGCVFAVTVGAANF